MHCDMHSFLCPPAHAFRLQVKGEGIQNILALRGDPPKGSSTFEAVEGGFSCALDLVAYIRQNYGSHFGITVSGYPEAHPDAIKTDPEEQKVAYAADLAYLKRKVEAGGEVIVTQLFYDVELFLKFVSDCRDLGITVPILPGVMPIQTYGGFKRMTGFCKTYVPPAIEATLEGIKDNEEAVKAYGLKLAVDMCRRMLGSGTPGVHLYSLNQDKAVTGILSGLGLIDTSCPPRTLPWRQPVSTKGRRNEEAVRPVFWAARPRSYLARTSALWTHGPPLAATGAVGDRGYSDAWDICSDAAVGMAATRPASEKGLAARQAALLPAPLASHSDVVSLFTSFLSGTTTAFPWSESGARTPELAAAATAVAPLLPLGFLPLDAGLSLAGVPSSAAATPGGWGHSGGRLYQKAFLHGFVPTASLDKVTAAVAGLRCAGSGSFLAATKDAGGEVAVTGSLADVTAVSWAALPRRAIVAPVVASRTAFQAWADEAFALWTSDWGALAQGGEEATLQVCSHAASTHALVFLMAEDAHAGSALFDAVRAALS